MHLLIRAASALKSTDGLTSTVSSTGSITEERVLAVGEYQIFNPVLYEWGLIDKIRIEQDEM